MRWLKHILPKSLYGRFLLIILLPMLLAQCMLAYIFYERHWSSMERNLSASLARELIYLHGLRHQSDAFVHASKHLYIASFPDTHTLKTDEHHRYPQLRELLMHHWPESRFSFQYNHEAEQLHVQVQGDRISRVYQIPRKRLSSSTTTIFILWMVGVSLLLSLIALLFLRNQIRSILHLTKAAQSFGRGNTQHSYKPHGAKEIRSAGLAFIQMQERIKRLLRRRTEMLANISHDLKTPLARMRLELALLPDHPKKQALEDDLYEMEAMLNEYLAFAKDTQSEAIAEVPLHSLLTQLTKQHETKLTTQILGEDITFEARPLALKRALQNIVNNAAKHASTLCITSHRTSEEIRMHFEDDGPGIPEHEREHVFQPFVKLDSARSNQKGSVGLGLTITRDIINAHGGSITLGKSAELGGLSVSITLPC